MRIQYKENTYNSQKFCFDFCKDCWLKKYQWFEEFMAMHMDIDLTSIEYNIFHEHYEFLGYYCLNCENKLTNKD